MNEKKEKKLLPHHKRSILNDKNIIIARDVSVFIKITVRGAKNFVEKEMEILQQVFANWKPIIFESSIEREGLPSAMNCIIKIPSENYPNKEIRDILFSLPSHLDIKINPDNLL